MRNRLEFKLQTRLKKFNAKLFSNIADDHAHSTTPHISIGFAKEKHHWYKR